ncbi:hypothetical protein [Granulicella sp. dw_53]|uniref:hypothetical protein n=1 Tax=Granulicella sp. dw_53 TaxID=2719792 RepID=UPI001BD3F9D4|nr:hypothetical protein [Granulicella sp. dw_53]
MTLVRKYAYLLPVALAASLITPLQAQQEGPAPTQTLVGVDAKSPVIPSVSNTTLKLNNHPEPLISLTRVSPSSAQVALLIDDGLRTSVGRELGALRSFVTTLPAGTEIFVGYMQNGRVVPAQGFTSDLATAAQSLRIPQGSPGISASPYFCLSDFVKKWPGEEGDSNSNLSAGPVHKARFVLMITDGVDPYNGSTSLLNQNSPYVSAAVSDAQTKGIPVYSIYFSDAGIRGGRASFSGQSYLQQVADGTGGRAYYIGTGNPVSLAPFLTQFQHAVAETYVATFNAPASKNLVRVKFETKLSNTKLRTPEDVRPGTHIVGTGQ